MTKEEFYRLVENRPELTDESIYRLTIRFFNVNVKEYQQTPDKQEWSYDIYKTTRFYSSKDEAEKAYLDYIHKAENIHSAIIDRLAINLPVDEGYNLAWWVFDNKGNEIDHSVCTSLFNDELTINDVYFGRESQQIPYKMGDIVEIIRGDKVYLEILNGIPPTIEEMWKQHDSKIKKWGENTYNYFSYLSDPMADRYFYLQEDGFDPDMPPYVLMKPVFPVPEEIREILTSRYNRWKKYVDSHDYDDINWDELHKNVKG